MKIPEKLKKKIFQRKENISLRVLGTNHNLIDFSSNDYLGFAKSENIFNQTHQFLIENNLKNNGATGSRLLTGNHFLYTEIETFLSNFHHSENALIFNSGYTANSGFFACVPQRGDVILYDQYIHASIRDGIQLSKATSYKYKHNNLRSLENRLKQNRKTFPTATIYIVTESVFSMDGDTPNLTEMVQLTKIYDAFLIVDEAHALGILGKNGSGLVQKLNLQNDVFARIIPFGKALGCHGAVIIGSNELKQFLLNFSHSFIYTTALPPHTLATIKTAYKTLSTNTNIQKLQNNIEFFKTEIQRLKLQNKFIKSNSAIHCCIISGNKKVKEISLKLQKNGFDVKSILSPTVPKEKERLRFCLHSYNSTKEITDVLKLLSVFIFER